MLTQQELSRVLLPIGDMEKSATREKAASLGFCVAAKPDSQEICFVADGDYASFVEERLPQLKTPGAVVSESGEKLGEHRGLARYTVGQRKGLGIASHEPLFVTKIDAVNNAIVVGPRESLGRETLSARGAKWAQAIPKSGEKLAAQTRAHSKAMECEIESASEYEFSIRFENPHPGVSPGQMCVLYRGDEVIGAGTIK
jgi:tRNA-specific 2-thiouridylase